MNISLYVNDTLVNAASDCENGSFFYYLFAASYDSLYTFYFNLTDGENTTISATYVFTTGEEPIIPPEEPEITPFPLSYSIAIVFATAAALFILGPHGKAEPVKAERRTRTRFLTLIFSFLAMGCNSPSLFNHFEGAKNNQNEMV
jgi:hypothetical protein